MSLRLADIAKWHSVGKKSALLQTPDALQVLAVQECLRKDFARRHQICIALIKVNTEVLKIK